MEKIFLIIMVLAMILFAGGLAFSQESNSVNQEVAAYAASGEPVAVVAYEIGSFTGPLYTAFQSAPTMIIAMVVCLLIISAVTISPKLKNYIFTLFRSNRTKSHGGAADCLIFPTV